MNNPESTTVFTCYINTTCRAVAAEMATDFTTETPTPSIVHAVSNSKCGYSTSNFCLSVSSQQLNASIQPTTCQLPEITGLAIGNSRTAIFDNTITEA